MGVGVRRQGIADHIGHRPDAAAVMAGGNDDAAGEHGGAARGGVRLNGQNLAQRRDADDLDIVADGEVSDRAVPAQIVHPVAPRDPADLLPRFSAVSRLEPGTHRQARYAEFGSDQGLWRTQHLHAGEGVPRSLVPGRVAVEQQDVAHAFALQGQSDDQPGLSSADNDNIVDLSPERVGDRPHPR